MENQQNNGSVNPGGVDELLKNKLEQMRATEEAQAEEGGAMIRKSLDRHAEIISIIDALQKEEDAADDDIYKIDEFLKEYPSGDDEISVKRETLNQRLLQIQEEIKKLRNELHDIENEFGKYKSTVKPKLLEKVLSDDAKKILTQRFSVERLGRYTRDDKEGKIDLETLKSSKEFMGWLTDRSVDARRDLIDKFNAVKDELTNIDRKLNEGYTDSGYLKTSYGGEIESVDISSINKRIDRINFDLNQAKNEVRKFQYAHESLVSSIKKDKLRTFSALRGPSDETKKALGELNKTLEETIYAVKNVEWRVPRNEPSERMAVGKIRMPLSLNNFDDAVNAVVAYRTLDCKRLQDNINEVTRLRNLMSQEFGEMQYAKQQLKEIDEVLKLFRG